MREDKQSDIFLKSEGDAWYKRNQAALAAKNYENDAVCEQVLAIANLQKQSAQPLRILEVGCGDARRIEWLDKRLQANSSGLDPSGQAVDAARSRGLDVKQGTADKLPFGDAEFDIVVFGFCLYLCDRKDLFQIAYEADRVLKPEGWVIIRDFYSAHSTISKYAHHEGVSTHKMDFKSIFSWNPFYTCFHHHVEHHVNRIFCDDPHEWVSTSVLRKLAGTE
jgi:ubiquinone/menaquinone biosynthesis C-methylase UbiE